MSTTDLVILISVALGFVFGFFKGFIKELAAVVAIIAGVYLSRIFSPYLSQLLQSNTSISPSTANASAYLIVFLLVVIVLFVVAHSLHKIFEAISLGGLNKVLGGIFGSLKVLLVISVLLNVYDAFQQRFYFDPLSTNNNVYPSKIYEFTIGFAPKLWDESQKYNILPQ